MRRTQEGGRAYALSYPIGIGRNCPTRKVFYVNYQNDSLGFCASAEESVCGAASLGLSGPPTAPLLGQLEHDAALLLHVEQDGRP